MIFQSQIVLNVQLSSEFNIFYRKMVIVRGCDFFYLQAVKWEPGSASDCPPFSLHLQHDSHP